MSELAAAGIPAQLQGIETISEEAWVLAKPYVAKFVWNWFNAHKDDVIYSIAGVFHIHVGIIEPILVTLFGEEPVTAPAPAAPTTPTPAV